MKYSIFGFNQAEVVKFGEVDIVDLLLLDYIYNAIASPTMLHKVDENNQPYVWLYHEKILQDLPILNIGEEALKKHIAKLKRVGLIKSLQDFTSGRKGSRSFYTITEECEKLRYTGVKEYTLSDEQVYKNTPNEAETGVKNYTSYKQVDIIDNTLNNNISSKEDILTENFDFGKKENKPRKNNLYTKCSAMIYNFTDIPALQKLLFTWLNMRLEIKDKPLYANQFKGILNKLDSYTESATELCEIVQQSIDRGYLSFFPINHYTRQGKSTHDAIHESGSGVVINDTKEDAEKREQFRIKMEAEGKKAVF